MGPSAKTFATAQLALRQGMTTSAGSVEIAGAELRRHGRSPGKKPSRSSPRPIKVLLISACALIRPLIARRRLTSDCGSLSAVDASVT